MALVIDNEETERLAEELAGRTGQSQLEAMTAAVRDRLSQLSSEEFRHRMEDRLNQIALEYGRLPLVDSRTEDEILDYDERGLPA